MARLDGYDFRGGRFPTTASIANALAHQRVTAPHTGAPYSEALLAGLAGGAAFGYFIFAYEGHDPQVNILTRNTFGEYGWDPVTERLSLVQEVAQATSPDRAREKLVATLDEGRAPIVWADVMTLGYESSELGEEMWMMQPLIVTAYEPGGEAVIDDRAGVPVRVSADRLDEARARIKKVRFRMVTLDAPEEANLADAVKRGIDDCAALYLEKPPKGSANNFGIKALTRWASALRKPTARGGWINELAAGRRRFAGLTTAFRYALLFWKDASRTADRALHADFLDEAATILGNDEYREVAGRFRKAGELWREAGDALLPDDVPRLARARELLVERHERFLGEGADSGERRTEIDSELEELARSDDEDLVTDDELATAHFAALADRVDAIREAEEEAVAAMKGLAR